MGQLESNMAGLGVTSFSNTGVNMAVLLEDWRYRQMQEEKFTLANLGSSRNETPVRLYGKTVGHPSNRDGKYLFVSPPVYFNEATRIVKTASGSEYQLGCCGGNEAQEFHFIRMDVLRNVSEKPASPQAKTPAVITAPVPPPAKAKAVAKEPEDDETDLDSLIEKAIDLPKRTTVAKPASRRKVYDANEVVKLTPRKSH